MVDVNVRSADPRNYQLPGSVSLWLLPRGEAGADKWKDLGNVINPNIEATVEELEHFSQRRGLRAKDRVAAASREAQLRFSIDEINLENLKIAFLQPEDVEVGSYTANFNKVIENPGENLSIDLGEVALSEVVIRGVSLETPVTYDEGYTLDTDTTEVTAGGDWNNLTNPLTVVDAVIDYPAITFTVGKYLRIGTEVLRVTVVAGNDVTFARGQFGTTIAVHADAAVIFDGTVEDYVVNLTTGLVYIVAAGAGNGAALEDETAVTEVHVFYQKVITTQKFEIFPGTTFEGQAKFQVFTPGGIKYAIEFGNVTLRTNGAITIGDGTTWQEISLQMDCLADENGELGVMHIVDDGEVTE